MQEFLFNFNFSVHGTSLYDHSDDLTQHEATKQDSDDEIIEEFLEETEENEQNYEEDINNSGDVKSEVKILSFYRPFHFWVIPRFEISASR